MNAENPTEKTGRYRRFIEILVGLLALIIGVIYLTPVFRLFSIPIKLQLTFLYYIIFGVVLLAIAVFGLIGAFTSGLARLTKHINAVTSILIITAAVTILFFQMIATGQDWFHFLFGISLLSYTVGRIAIVALAHDYKIGLRAFILGIASAVGVLSVIVILFTQIFLSASTNSNHLLSGTVYVFMSSDYFVIIALVLIRVDFLVAAILTLLRQKQSPQGVLRCRIAF